MEARQEQARYDKGQIRKSHRSGRKRGIDIYIPAAELRKAGIDPHGPAPTYRLSGYQRSKSGHSVIVSLYAELAEGTALT